VILLESEVPTWCVWVLEDVHLVVEVSFIAGIALKDRFQEMSDDLKDILR